MLKAVRRNNNIFNVILQYNNLSGGNGGFAIQDMIKKSKSIINLDLSNNRICNSEQRYMVLTAERSNRKINITFNTKIDDNRIYNENRKQYLLYAFNSAPPGATVYFVDESSSSSNSSDTEMEPEKYDVTKWKAIVY